MKMHALKLAGLGITGSVIWRFLQSKHGFSAFSHIFSAADDSSFSHFHFLTSSIFSSRQFVPFVPFDRDHDLNDKKHPFNGCRSRGMTSGFTFPSYKLNQIDKHRQQDFDELWMRGVTLLLTGAKGLASETAKYSAS